MALLDTVRPDVVAVLVGRWEVMDWTHDGRWTHIGDPAFDGYLATELDSAVRLLGSRGAGVALLTTSLPPGTHSVVASYPGDAVYGASTSDPLLQEVGAAPKLEPKPDRPAPQQPWPFR